MSTRKPQPLDKIEWVPREELKPNSYNPNKVATPEMRLLKISIMEDGWTQPIVRNQDGTIVDGFHRWTVSADKEVYALTDGLVPVVTLSETDPAQQKMATIRHNRARGTHGVLAMSDIVKGMVEDGLTGEEIMKRLQMEQEEVTRLLMQAGIPRKEAFKDMEFSRSWKPQ